MYIVTKKKKKMYLYKVGVTEFILFTDAVVLLNLNFDEI